jgi:hypothetical protein
VDDVEDVGGQDVMPVVVDVVCVIEAGRDPAGAEEGKVCKVDLARLPTNFIEDMSVFGRLQML